MVRPSWIPYDSSHAAGEPAQLSVASAGPLLESNAIPIVIATYQILVLGDSIAWGEGLEPQEKYCSLVATHVATANPNISVYTTQKAHTGAILGWWDPTVKQPYDGDIPTSYPTVRHQAEDAARALNASTIDLILLSATINDVGLSHIFDPEATHPSIDARIAEFCQGDLLAFLTWLKGAFPAAKIVVTGYYAPVSPLSLSAPGIVDVIAIQYGLDNHKGLAPRALEIELGLDAGYSIVTDNAVYFAAQANQAIAATVASADQGVSPARIVFADPKFLPQNAAYASNPWVFELNNSAKVLQPTDSSAAVARRTPLCQAAYPGDTPDDVTNRTFCELASAGHPNALGAQAYSSAIILCL
jgi:lysophospholipase L1-like esterase